MDNKIINQEAEEFLSQLSDRSVDLFILDPPYYNVVNDEWDNQWKSIDHYLEWCNSWMKLVGQKSKFSGSLWLFGFPYQLTRLISIVESVGFKFRQQIVCWKGMKSAAGRTSSKLKMYPTTTESIFFFAYDSQPIIKDMLNEQKNRLKLSSKEINEYLGKASNGGGTWSSIAGLNQTMTSQPTRNDWDKLNILFENTLPDYDNYVFKFNLKMGLTDVWDDINFTPARQTRIHPTQKPVELITRIIETSTNPGDLVVDPFVGSGSSSIASIHTQRNFIGCELNTEYYEKTIKRIQKEQKISDLFSL
jgi:site-specific DNA-methyltransferase (adenine-specific)